MRLDQPVSEPPSPRTLHDLQHRYLYATVHAILLVQGYLHVYLLSVLSSNGGDTAANLANNIHALRQEVARLKRQLEAGKAEHERKMAMYEKEEKEIREENLR